MKSKIKLLVTIEVECMEKLDGPTRKDFEKYDVPEMAKYLSKHIRDEFPGKWKWSARVTQAKAKGLPLDSHMVTARQVEAVNNMLAIGEVLHMAIKRGSVITTPREKKK
jgi:hypothetical protein